MEICDNKHGVSMIMIYALHIVQKDFLAFPTKDLSGCQLWICIRRKKLEWLNLNFNAGWHGHYERDYISQFMIILSWHFHSREDIDSAKGEDRERERGWG